MTLWNEFLDRFRKPEPRPAWASFFTDEQYQRFRHIVERYFQSQQKQYTWGDGVVSLEPVEPGGVHQLGLVNLAQLCARSEEREWTQIVEDHFRTLEKSHTEQKVLEQRVTDFDRVGELLAVRLWPDTYLNELDETRMIFREDLPGTISALVYDLPSSIRNVTPDETKEWGKELDHLFRLALDNVREICIPDVSEQDLGDGVKVQLLSDESFFVASHALLLEEHERCVGSFGALVGVPHRHVLLAYPIESLEVVQAIPRLIAVIVGMEREGPGSISPRIYWYQAGDYVDLPYRIEGDTLHFSPPEAFVEMMNLLGESGDERSEENEESEE
jgi:hypothetical protein